MVSVGAPASFEPAREATLPPVETAERWLLGSRGGEGPSELSRPPLPAVTEPLSLPTLPTLPAADAAPVTAPVTPAPLWEYAPPGAPAAPAAMAGGAPASLAVTADGAPASLAPAKLLLEAAGRRYASSSPILL